VAPSLVKFNQRLFLAVYAVFFAFAIYVVWQILWSGAGLRTVQEAAFLDNENKMRRLEMQVETRIKALKQRLSALCTLNTEAELQEFRSSYPQKIRQILETELSAEEYRLCLSGLLTPPVQLLPFRLDPYTFRQLADSIEAFFAGQQYFPVMGMDKFFSAGDDDFFAQIAALNIRPRVDISRQTIQFSPADLEKLSSLSSTERPLFLRHKKMEMVANPKLLGFQLDTIELWEPDRDYAAYLFNLPEDVIGPLRWLVQLVLRTESRFGRVPSVYIDSSGETPVYKEDPRLSLAEQLFPDREESRGSFFRTRSADASVSYIWNWYPTDYGNYEIEKQQEWLGLLPEQIFVGYINELRMTRSYIVDAIVSGVEGFDFGIQVRYGNGTDFVHAFQKSGLPDFFQELDHNHVKIFSTEKGLSDFSDSAEWLQKYFQSTGILPENRRPFDFSFKNKNGDSFYGSLRVSSFLGGAHVLIYQPVWRFLFPYYLQWFFIGLLFLLTVPVYFYIRGRYARRISDSVNSCLTYIEKGAEGEEISGFLQDEMDVLRSAMGRFNSLIRETLFHFDLNLGFQKILNQPRLSFLQYAEQFEAFSNSLPAGYQFIFPGVTDSTSVDGWEIKVEPDVEQKIFLQEKLHLPGELPVVFKGRKSPLKEAEELLFRKYFQALLQKAYLEDQYVQSQNLKKDLELGEQVRSALSPQPETLPSGLRLSWQNLSANQLNGNFYDMIELENCCHFYMVRVIREGIGAGLIACHLKSFIVANADCLTTPEQMTKNLHNFSTDGDFADVPIEVIYASLSLNDHIFSFSCTGEMGLLLFDGNKCRNLALEKKSLAGIKLKNGDRFLLYSPELVPVQVFGTGAKGVDFFCGCLVENRDCAEISGLLQEKFTACNYQPEFDGMLFMAEIKDEEPTI
jgi:hypothetical protein